MTAGLAAIATWISRAGGAGRGSKGDHRAKGRGGQGAHGGPNTRVGAKGGKAGRGGGNTRTRPAPSAAKLAKHAAHMAALAARAQDRAQRLQQERPAEREPPQPAHLPEGGDRRLRDFHDHDSDDDAL